MEERTFTVDEIREYMRGGLLYVAGDDQLEQNAALRVRIAELEDAEDGIAAVTDRIKRMRRAIGAKES